MERGIALWRRHWRGLFLACLVAAMVPGLTAAVVGAGLGILPMETLDALRLLLPGQTLEQPVGLVLGGGLSGWWVPALIHLALLLLGAAGLLGILRPIVHDGRPPKMADFIEGIRRYTGRLLVVRVLCSLVLAAGGLVALLVHVLAGFVLAGWLTSVAALAVFFAATSAVLYADFALVVEDGTAMEAVGDSVGVLTERWQEALAANGMFILISVLGEVVAWLLTRIVAGPAGLLLGVAPMALAESVVRSYLLVRYVENVHRGTYGRMGRFAIDGLKAG